MEEEETARRFPLTMMAELGHCCGSTERMAWIYANVCGCVWLPVEEEVTLEPLVIVAVPCVERDTDIVVIDVQVGKKRISLLTGLL